MTVLSNILNVVITLLVFFTIILIHEFGHFFTAKMFGMKIYEFSIGMGPRLFSKKTKTTTWSFKLLPIGGAVQLGEDFESEDPDDFHAPQARGRLRHRGRGDEPDTRVYRVRSERLRIG